MYDLYIFHDSFIVIVKLSTKYACLQNTTYRWRNNKQLNQAKNIATAPASISRWSPYPNKTGPTKRAEEIYKTHSRVLFKSVRYFILWNIEYIKIQNIYIRQSAWMETYLVYLLYK